MADAATVDLRGDAVLPWALRVLGRPNDAGLRDAVDEAARVAARRRAPDRRQRRRRLRARRGDPDHGRLVAALDARRSSSRCSARALFDAMVAVHALDNHPNNHGDHVGSAWQDGWYSFAQKDLRDAARPSRPRPLVAHLLRQRARCGAAARALERSLKQALAADPADALRATRSARDEGRDGEQACFDAIWHRPLGGITQPLIPWQNRPTFQQVVEIPKRLPR